MVTLKFNAVELALVIAIISTITATCGLRISIEDNDIGYAIVFGFCTVSTMIIFVLLRMAL